MEKANSTATTSSSYGAGGRFHKPSSRKPPTTPYSRPSTNQSSSTQQQNDVGWLSKIVFPAYRLISGSANRILPSLFTKSNVDTHNVERDVCFDDKEGTSDHGNPILAENFGPSRVEENPISQSEVDGQSRDNVATCSEVDELSRIEQLMQGKRFSRDEINRLTEILHSRAAGLSDVEQGMENAIMVKEPEAAEPDVAHEISRSLSEERQEDLSKALRRTSTPYRQATIGDEVGASPVDIARAYMGGRTSELGLASRSIVLKDERAMRQSNDFASMPIVPSPSKSSICWPGAVVQDHRGYSTPKNQRNKFGLHNFPRTPYSRTMYSKSRSKMTYLHGDGNKSLNISPAPFQHSQTPSYLQMTTASDSLRDGYGSVGPIRRSRHNIAAESPYRGSVSLQESLKHPSYAEKSLVDRGSTPVFKSPQRGTTSRSSMFKSVESNRCSFEVGGPTVHPQSSHIARKILEQIDRKVPTRQEKAAELRIASSWNKSLSSEVTALMPKENIRSELSHDFGSYKNANGNDQELCSRYSEDGRIPLAIVNATVSQNTDTNHIDFGIAHDDNSRPSLHFGKTSEIQPTGTSERGESIIWTGHNENGQDSLKTITETNGSDVFNLQKKQQFQSHGNKPVLASISVDRPQARSGVTSDYSNSFGFTFPVSASSGVFSEPPTPSIMPLSSASVSHQPTEGVSDIPSYTFGSKRTAPALVFSFPSTSNASTQVDASDIKFNFGSDKKSRVSFSSVGKNAICY